MGRLSHVVAWVVPAVAATIDAFRQGLNDGEGDAHIFIWAGRTLLSGQWSHAFSHSIVQAGPLQLALFGSLGRSSDALALVLAPATALLVVAAVRAVGVTNPVLYGGAGLLAVATGLTRVGYAAGHPADAVLPLIWILAAADARRGHVYRAGLLVGLCAGLETWGILGVAVLAFAPRRREAAIGALVAGATALALFLPFLLGGHFAMLSLQWQVRPPAPISLFVAPALRSGGRCVWLKASSRSGPVSPSPGSCATRRTGSGPRRSRSSARGCCSIPSSCRTTSPASRDALRGRGSRRVFAVAEAQSRVEAAELPPPSALLARGLARAKALAERVDAAMDLLPLVRDFALAIACGRRFEAEVDLMLQPLAER